MNASLLTEALKLPAPERIELAEALWDSVQRDTDAFPVPNAHVAILEKRLRDMEANPQDETTWEEVRDRLQKLE
ncbi:MAG TPA: addiction module protein [Thermoanaerobaculia bacterium]|nr:addiction module protein [Thermoanaerobaculia bacterium]